MKTLRVQVWSDVACPWCYVGKRRLEAAAGRLPPEVVLEVAWRSFELDPTAPRTPPGVSYATRLARKYDTSEEVAQDRIAQMVAVAAADGLTLRFDRIRPGNTFDAHRLLHLARGNGRHEALQERLFQAYFGEGAAIGDPAALEPLAIEAGLAPADVARVLTTEAYAAEVRADEAEAYRLGIHAVPFFVLQERYGVSGAQPADVLADAMTRALSDTVGEGAGAAVCEPDGRT